jgi:hypothetical protein
MSLTLRSLPTLLTDCVIVGHARKADVFFTPRQFFAICAHIHNDNPRSRVSHHLGSVAEMISFDFRSHSDGTS